MHLTDLHFRRAWWPGYDVVLDRLRADPPDVVLVTGDFVDDQADHTDAMPTLRRFLDGLTSRLGTFAVLGNHDGDNLRRHLAGVTLLDGATHAVRPDVQLLGLPGVWRGDQLQDQLPPLTPRPPVRLLLTHYPDTVKRLGPLNSQLILSGHTHGGQVCLPNGHPLLTHDALPKSMCHGLHDWQGTPLLIGRGLGCSTLQLRTFCPAEVWELVLTPAGGDGDA